MPLGANSRMKASLTSFGWISQKTCASRTRRAISCVTWEPKSRIRILSCMDVPRLRWVAASRRGGRRRALRKWRPGEAERDRLQQRRRSRTARRCASRRAAGARPSPAAARRSPARPPPSGCSGRSPRPSSGPACVGSAALEMMLWIDAATAKPSTLTTMTAYIIQPSVAAPQPT